MHDVPMFDVSMFAALEGILMLMPHSARISVISGFLPNLFLHRVSLVQSKASDFNALRRLIIEPFSSAVSSWLARHQPAIMRITRAQLAGVDKYKYSGVDKSVVSKHILGPFWTWLVTLFPKTLAPNTVRATA